MGKAQVLAARRGPPTGASGQVCDDTVLLKLREIQVAIICLGALPDNRCRWPPERTPLLPWCCTFVCAAAMLPSLVLLRGTHAGGAPDAYRYRKSTACSKAMLARLNQPARVAVRVT